jgi:hypothetical protein
MSSSTTFIIPTKLPPMIAVESAQSTLAQANVVKQSMENAHYDRGAYLCAGITVIGFAILLADKTRFLNLNPIAKRICIIASSAEALIGTYFGIRHFSYRKELNEKYREIERLYDKAREYIENESGVIAGRPHTTSRYIDYQPLHASDFNKADFDRLLDQEIQSIWKSTELYHGNPRLSDRPWPTSIAETLQNSCRVYLDLRFIP